MNESGQVQYSSRLDATTVEHSCWTQFARYDSHETDDSASD